MLEIKRKGKNRAGPFLGCLVMLFVLIPIKRNIANNNFGKDLIFSSTGFMNSVTFPTDICDFMTWFSNAYDNELNILMCICVRILCSSLRYSSEALDMCSHYLIIIPLFQSMTYLLERQFHYISDLQTLHKTLISNTWHFFVNIYCRDSPSSICSKIV